MAKAIKTNVLRHLDALKIPYETREYTVEDEQFDGLLTARKLGMDPAEISVVISAIGNHDESTAFPVNPVAAALILADKTDVRRTRVRNQDLSSFDIHDRVNYAVTKSSAFLTEDRTEFVLRITVDTEISPVLDYFEIFMERMLLCRRASAKLGLQFRLSVNGQMML